MDVLEVVPHTSVFPTTCIPDVFEMFKFISAYWSCIDNAIHPIHHRGTGMYYKMY
jgi:hypothetical protein